MVRVGQQPAAAADEGTTRERLLRHDGHGRVEVHRSMLPPREGLDAELEAATAAARRWAVLLRPYRASGGSEPPFAALRSAL